MTDEARAAAERARPRGARTLFGPAEIDAAVDRLAARIRDVYAGEEITALVAMRGGLIFAADLIRRLDMPLRLEVLQLSSYHGAATSPGELRLHPGAEIDVQGRHVLVIDDILDTGRTLKRLQELVLAQSPRSLRTVTLLDKPSRREVDVQVDFTGLEVPDVFVVGYGLDFNERYRNLPEIVALDDPSTAE